MLQTKHGKESAMGESEYPIWLQIEVDRLSSVVGHLDSQLQEKNSLLESAQNRIKELEESQRSSNDQMSTIDRVAALHAEIVRLVSGYND